MAIWDVYQYNTNLTTGRTNRAFIKQVDDTERGLNQDVLDLFGVGERGNVQVSAPEDGIIEARIQYSQSQRAGWLRDREVDYDYIVVFRAERRAEP